MSRGANEIQKVESHHLYFRIICLQREVNRGALVSTACGSGWLRFSCQYSLRQWVACSSLYQYRLRQQAAAAERLRKLARWRKPRVKPTNETAPRRGAVTRIHLHIVSARALPSTR